MIFKPDDNLATGNVQDVLLGHDLRTEEVDEGANLVRPRVVPHRDGGIPSPTIYLKRSVGKFGIYSRNL